MPNCIYFMSLKNDWLVVLAWRVTSEIYFSHCFFFSIYGSMHYVWLDSHNFPLGGLSLFGGVEVRFRTCLLYSGPLNISIFFWIFLEDVTWIFVCASIVSPVFLRLWALSFKFAFNNTAMIMMYFFEGKLQITFLWYEVVTNYFCVVRGSPSLIVLSLNVSWFCSQYHTLVDFLCFYIWKRLCEILNNHYGVCVTEEGLSNRGFEVTRLNTYMTVK